MLHFVLKCQRSAHDFYGIVYQTLLLETSDIHFSFRIFVLNSLSLRGLALKLIFFQYLQKIPNMNHISLDDSNRINAAEIFFIRERKQKYEIKSMWNIPCTICSKIRMVGSLNSSESILYATSEVYHNLNSKRISLVVYEGCLHYFICHISLALFFLDQAPSSV